jgi:hypothetical protein
MEPLSIIIGAAAVCFGLTTAVLRVIHPGMFRRLKAMQETWGKTSGTVIHWIAYTIAPILVGISFIVAGVRGIPLFGR